MTSDIQIDWPVFAWHIASYCIASWILYIALLSVYRVTLHPLAKFPGPQLAGASYCYEFWFEVICGAQYTLQIKKLHERYGPIIRISPDELHCNDPNFVDVVYPTGNRKRDKSRHYTLGWASASNSAFGTTDHIHHRIRRGALNKFFSRSRVLKIEDFIQENAQKLCDKFLSFRSRGRFEATSAFNCFTTDTVTEYCFGSSPGFIAQDGWEPNYKDTIEVVERMTHITRHIPWVRSLKEWVPLPVVKLISTSMYSFLVSTRVVTPERINRVESVFETNGSKNCPVFLELLNSDLPPEEKSIKRLTYESNGVTLAGPATTAATLSNVTYHLLINPHVCHKLREELLTKIADPMKLPSWSTLEELPYLTGVIHEGLRLLYDSSKERLPYETSQERLPRIATEEDLEYEDGRSPPHTRVSGKSKHIIPRGYAVGMSAYLLHLDESVFPNATQFIPERWLDEKGQRNRGLERHLLAFSKGSRQCLGMQLAYCELYICVAALVLRVMPQLELYEEECSGVEFDPTNNKHKSRMKGIGLRIVDA